MRGLTLFKLIDTIQKSKLNAAGSRKEMLKVKLVKILSVFAVIAAAGMMAEGCVNLTGAGNGYDEAVFAAAAGLAPGSGGGTTALSAAAVKTIKVKFRVLNGGWGLTKSEGIIGTPDDSHLVLGGGRCANDYTITIFAPADVEYLNVYWRGEELLAPRGFLFCAKTKAESGTITVDYNGFHNDNGNFRTIATENLYDVYQVNIDLWDGLKDHAFKEDKEEFAGCHIIKVKFEVKNGGWGLVKSQGIVSTEDDGYLVYGHDVCANDYTIELPVPDDNEFLNIRWKGREVAAGNTWLYARMKLKEARWWHNYTITLDYNGNGKVATKELSDVVVSGGPYGKKTPYGLYLGPDWDEAKKYTVND